MSDDIRDAIVPLLEIAAELADAPDDLVVASAWTDRGRVDITARHCRVAAAAMSGPHVLQVRADREWQMAHPLRCKTLLECPIHLIFSEAGVPDSVWPGSYEVALVEKGDAVELELRAIETEVEAQGVPEGGSSLEAPIGVREPAPAGPSTGGPHGEPEAPQTAAPATSG